MVAIPKIGVNIVPVPTPVLTRFARMAEELGFESLWSGEHVCLPQSADWWKLYPSVVAAGDRGHAGMVPFKPHTQFLGPLTVLSHLAAVTTKIRLGVGIYLLALREAVLVGRTIASLDQLSGGRLDLGVGLGWTPDEYQFTGNDWSKRGRKMDETILALRALFEQAAPEFHGEFYDSRRSGSSPSRFSGRCRSMWAASELRRSDARPDWATAGTGAHCIFPQSARCLPRTGGATSLLHSA